MSLQETIVDNFEKVKNHFNLNCSDYKRFWGGTCPLHDGDNPNSFALYKDGNDNPGSWQCYTKDCHRKYGGTALGLIRGLLSKQNNRMLEFPEVLLWCEQFFNIKTEKLPTKNLFDNVINASLRNTQIIDTGLKLTLAQFNSITTNDTSYFVDRNYKQETLEHFNLRLCNNPTKPMFNRILVPHFDEAGEYIIGVAGRSIWEKCKLCKGYHNPNSICKRSGKWINTPNFPRRETLYNFHRAKEFIEKSGIAILVEGKPNVMRLYESNFPMGMACFGNNFLDEQKFALDKTGAHTIIVVPDAGEAGQSLVKDVKSQCKYSHNIVTIEPTYEDDIGRCNIDTVKRILGPIVDKYHA